MCHSYLDHYLANLDFRVGLTVPDGFLVLFLALEFENQDVNIPLTGFFADPEVFDLFQYELEYGDSKTALEKPFTVVLTRKAASKIFKEENKVAYRMKICAPAVILFKKRFDEMIEYDSLELFEYKEW